MISYKHKIIFIHIPRTGGGSIERIFWPTKKERAIKNLWMGRLIVNEKGYQTDTLQHLLAKQVKLEVDNNIFSSFFKFTIVRNPWDKVVSQYMHINGGPRKKRSRLRTFIGIKRGESFEKYLSLLKTRTHSHWESQYKFFLDGNGEQIVDEILRFENFENEVREILKKLGFENANIPHENKSVREHYRNYYSKETREIVREIYKKDIELLNYKY